MEYRGHRRRRIFSSTPPGCVRRRVLIRCGRRVRHGRAAYGRRELPRQGGRRIDVACGLPATLRRRGSRLVGSRVTRGRVAPIWRRLGRRGLRCRGRGAGSRTRRWRAFVRSRRLALGRRVGGGFGFLRRRWRLRILVFRCRRLVRIQISSFEVGWRRLQTGGSRHQFLARPFPPTARIPTPGGFAGIAGSVRGTRGRRGTIDRKRRGCEDTRDASPASQQTPGHHPTIHSSPLLRGAAV
jgi:hypothetical protein